MALTGKEIIYCTGLINSGPSGQREYTTTQNVANLANGGPSALSGSEVLYCYGPSGSNIPSSVQFATTTGAINALGSIAPSTLTGTELIHVIPATSVGGAPAAKQLQTTTLAIANS